MWLLRGPRPARPDCTEIWPPPTPSFGCVRRLGHRDRVAGDGAEVLAHVVVTRLARLHAADLVGGPRHQSVSPSLVHIPAVRPAHPHETIARLLDMGGVPTLAAVDA